MSFFKLNNTNSVELQNVNKNKKNNISLKKIVYYNIAFLLFQKNIIANIENERISKTHYFILFFLSFLTFYLIFFALIYVSNIAGLTNMNEINISSNINTISTQKIILQGFLRFINAIICIFVILIINTMVYDKNFPSKAIIFFPALLVLWEIMKFYFFAYPFPALFHLFFSLSEFSICLLALIFTPFCVYLLSFLIFLLYFPLLMAFIYKEEISFNNEKFFINTFVFWFVVFASQEEIIKMYIIGR